MATKVKGLLLFSELASCPDPPSRHTHQKEGLGTRLGPLPNINYILLQCHVQNVYFMYKKKFIGVCMCVFASGDRPSAAEEGSGHETTWLSKFE